MEHRDGGRPEPPFVGREAQLAWLVEALAGRPPGIAMLAGVAGVGKTRLAEEALRALGGRGWHCLRGYAVAPGRTIPLAALAGMLPGVPDPSVAGSGTEPVVAGMVSNALRALAELAATGPTVILLDDCHLLDDLSAIVLHQAAVHGSVALLVTARAGERLPEPIAALWRSGRAQRLDLDPLDDEQVGRLVTGWLDGPVAQSTVDNLRTLSAGSPLLVRELVLAAQATGALHRGDGLWQLRELPVPARLEELLPIRLEEVSQAERAGLELLALAEPIGVRLLQRLAGPEVVESLEKRALIVVRQDRRRWPARLAHPLYGEVLRRTVPVTTRMRWYRRLADTMEAYGLRRGGDLLAWASWRIDGGGMVDPQLMAAAAYEVCDQPVAPALRERLAVAAWEAAGDLDSGVLLCRVLIEADRGDEAMALLTRLAELVTTDHERRHVATARAWYLGWGQGRVAEALAGLRSAAAELADPATAATLRADRANLLACAGRPRYASRLAATVDLTEYPALTVRVGAAVSIGLLLSGRLSQLRNALAGSSVPPPSRCPMFPAEYAAGSLPIDVWGYDGELATARQVGVEILPRTAGLGDRHAHASALTSLALVEVVTGRLDTARRYVAEALPVWREFGIRQYEVRCLAAGVLAALGQGDVAGAEPLAARLAQLRPAVDQLELFTFEADRAAAWHRFHRGGRQAARRLLATRATRWARRGGVLPAVLLAADLARMGGARGIADLVGTLALPPSWRLGTALAGFVRAMAAGEARELAAVASTLEELGCHLYAAEAAAAGGQRARASSLAGRCERPNTPLLAEVRDLPRLTDREREIATLVAEGHSNQAVAQRLTLSVRTVENHLHRIFSKLGVNRRGEVAQKLPVEHI